MSDKTFDLFTAKLSHAIERTRVSKTDLARKVGVAPQQIHSYMAGSQPKPPVMLALSRELGLPLGWWLDESIEDLDPPVSREGATGDPGSFQDREITDLLDELSRRYARTVNSFLKALHTEETIARNWQESAAVVMAHLQTPTSKLPEQLDSFLTYTAALDSLATGIVHFSVTAGTHADRHLPRHLLALARGTPGEVLDYWDQYCQSNPGLEALIELSQFFGLEDDNPRKVRWIQFRAPYIMARLLTHPDVASEARFDSGRQKLKELGYIDAEGNPVENEEQSYPPAGGVPLLAAREFAKHMAQFRKADDGR